MQDTRRSTREVVERMTRMRKSYHFFLQAGDLSYADGNLVILGPAGVCRVDASLLQAELSLLCTNDCPFAC